MEIEVFLELVLYMVYFIELWIYGNHLLVVVVRVDLVSLLIKWLEHLLVRGFVYFLVKRLI